MSTSQELRLEPRPLKSLGERLFETTFADSPDFEPRWWSKIVRGSERSVRHFSAMVWDQEVARIELVEKDRLNPDFIDVPSSSNGFLEISFFEVATPVRRRGLGTESIGAVAEAFTGRSLAAYSEDADGFWASLGWDRFEHGEDPQLFRPLYVHLA